MKLLCLIDVLYCDFIVKYKILGYIWLLSEEVICNIEIYYLLFMYLFEVKEEECILMMLIY